MKLVVFGLTVSSSWGNGHATLWRGLIRALSARGHDVVFFERDQPFYGHNRDLHALPGADLVLYRDWEDVRVRALGHLLDADAAMVTSYCPDGRCAAELIGEAGVLSVFYDMDTPVTLARLAEGAEVPYLPVHGLSDFDLVLSYTGGEALELLRTRLGARRTAPLYGHADPHTHHRVPADPRFGCDISYIGTYAADRQPGVDALFVEPARRRPGLKFVLAGSGYPPDFPWTDNIWFVQHLPPPEHPAFYSSSGLTVNVTRADMAAMGWCPSGRLFEAAACATPVLSDAWPGLDAFFAPGEEILTASDADGAVAALDLGPEALARIAGRAHERFMAEHTSDHRARELLDQLSAAASGVPAGPSAAAPRALQEA